MCTRRLSGLCLCETLEARRGMASQTTSLLILLIIASDASSNIPIVLTNLSLTATEGSCVEIKCTVTGTLTDEDALWFWIKDGIWNKTEKEFTGTIVYSNKITEQPISPSFEGRVNYTGSQRLTRPAGSDINPLCSILICDLKIEDNGTYFFRYKDPTQKWKTVNDVVLTVRENLCPITFNKPEPVMDSSNITLQCSTVGSCSSYLYIESVPLSGFETLTSTSGWRNATLSFRASWEDDGREFICQTKWNKDIHLAKKTTVTVQYAPSVKVKVISPSSSFTQGQRVTLTCEVIRSNPPPDAYTWFKNGNSLSSGQTYNKTLQPEDSGSYTCSATNTVADGHSSPLQINVLYPPSQVTLTMDTEVIEGQRITITCSVDSSPKSHLILNRTSGTNLLEKLQEVTDNNTLSYTFSVTSAHAGVYTCHAQNPLGSNSTQRQLQVKYRPKHVTVQVDPGLDVKENMTLRLSCSAQSNPPVTSVTWTINGRNLTEHKGSTFTVKSVTPNDSGLYSCTAYNDFGKGQSQPVEVKVKWKLEIMNTSGCVYQSEVLTCVCISRGSPHPTVTWSLLETHTEYSVVTMVTGGTVNSTFVLRVKDHNRTEVQCVSSNRMEQVQGSFRPTIRTNPTEPQDPFYKIIQVVTRLEVIIAFVVGFVLSALLCCVLNKCHRRKQKRDGKERDLTETLEMLNGHAVEVADANAEPRELHYSSIDFFVLQKKGKKKREKKEETPETEYSEIKTKKMEQMEENDKVDKDILENKEEAAMIVENEETKQRVPEEEQQEEVALYSNVKELMADL